jgi:hypothetical protein
MIGRVLHVITEQVRLVQFKLYGIMSGYISIGQFTG